MAPAPQPRARKGVKRGTLFTDDGTPIQVSLTANDQDVLISTDADSVSIPVHGLCTRPEDTGYVAEQVAVDAALRRRDQIVPGIGQLEEGHHIVVNGLKYEVVEPPNNKYSQDAAEYRMTLKPA